MLTPKLTALLPPKLPPLLSPKLSPLLAPKLSPLLAPKLTPLLASKLATTICSTCATIAIMSWRCFWCLCQQIHVTGVGWTAICLQNKKVDLTTNRPLGSPAKMMTLTWLKMIAFKLWES